MALRFTKGDKFAGYKVDAIYLSDDGIERYGVRREDSVTRRLLHCPAQEDQADPARDAPVEPIAARLASIDAVELPTLLEARQTDGFPWVICEYPPLSNARKLSTALQGWRFESVANALALMDSIAALLEHASKRGFVHGRLHPGLIWIDNRNRLVKVFDLGFSEIFGPMPLSCPHRYCLAPEQINGAPASERSDIYTMGVILYELLAGHPIFVTAERAPKRAQMIDLILTQEPAALSSIRPIRPDVEAFVFRAMAKREADRFASLGAFRSALQVVAARYLRDEPISGPLAVPDSSEPSDPDRVQRDTLESAPSVDPSVLGSAAAGDLPPPSPPEAPHSPPVELPPASPAVVPIPASPAAELPDAPELPGPMPDEVPAPRPARMPANDQGRPTREWRQRRKKKEPIAAIAVVALLVIVLLSIAAVWKDAPRSARIGAPSLSATATAVELLPAALLLPIPPAPPPSAADKERARALLLQATDAVIADQWAKAEGLLRAAWQLEKTHDIAGNLGDVELTNGKPRDAAEHLRFSLEALPPTAATELRARVQRRFDEARELVAALRITVDTPGVEVSIDGAPVGLSPLRTEVFVNPGDRIVTARLAGYDATPVIVTAMEGGTYDVTLRRAPGAPTVVEAPAVSSPGNPANPAAVADPTTSSLVEAPPRAVAKAAHRTRRPPAKPAPSQSASPEVAELREAYQYAPRPEAGR
jgi:serine/threonine protein kinase